MSKPSWDDAPEWANWLACDEEGGWWWYQFEPVFVGDGWICDSMQVGKIEHAMDDYKNLECDETLEERQ